MRYFLGALLQVLVLTDALAWDFGGASGKNAIGQIIAIEGSYVNLKLSIYPKNPKDSTPQTFTFDNECSVKPSTNPNFHGIGESFSCRKDSESPLAGVTYKVVADKGKCAGWIYYCIRGCGSKNVPNIMYENRWEC